MRLKVRFQGSFFSNQKCFIITGTQLGYLTAFFNSQLFRFAFKEFFPELLGDTRELSKVFFENVTVKPIPAEVSNVFEGLVDRIQALKQQQKPTDELEAMVETRLAELYGLSEAEKALIKLSKA